MDTSPRPGDPDFGSTIPADGKPILAGRYRVLRKLGEGGMGEVYLAEDQKLDNKRFAIKMPPAVLARNARAMETLKKEALRAMELSHPHIVTVRSFEQSDDGVFIIMDYVEGETLEELLRRKGTLNENELLRIFNPIAAALDYAHKKNVIHRDVKPSNIIVATDGSPYIMDFGIAREAKESFTSFTGKETTSGTLPYMSPEQVRGKSPAPAQDVYSLAATMYECLASHPPFHRGDLHYQIIHETPESPPLESGSAGSSPLVKLIMRGLAKDSGDRPVSCAALVKPEPLKKKIAPKPVAPPEPKPQTSPAPVVKPQRQPKGPRPAIAPRVIGVLAVLVLTAVFVMVLVSQMDRAPTKSAWLSSPELREPLSAPRETRTSPGPTSSTPSGSEPTPSETTPSITPSTTGTNPDRGKTRTFDLGNGLLMTFVRIEKGSFQMGLPSGDRMGPTDLRQHRVTISNGFWMGETEVTQAQWKAVLKTSPWSGKLQVHERDDSPAVYVSWQDTKSFCDQLSQRTGMSVRLPSEAEWEYACRAGTQTRFSFGDDYGDLGRYSWYSVNASDAGEKYAHAVRTKAKNPLGLYDMHGNVWEWCEDPLTVLDDSMPSRRMLRGGSWINPPTDCRSTTRGASLAASISSNVGFRVCLDLEENPPTTSDPSDMESDATSTIDVTLDEIKSGEPIVTRGLEIKPRRPSFTTLTMLNAAPGNPFVELRFTNRGTPEKAKILESSGDRRVDEAILNSLYRWRANGERLTALGDNETVNIRVRILLLAPPADRAPSTPSSSTPSGSEPSPSEIAPPSVPLITVGTNPVRGEPWTADLGNDVKMNFVWIEKGSFRIGSNSGAFNERPVHDVHISKGFWIGETEVTQAQYRAVTAQNPGQFTGDMLPASFVSWHAAKAFCEQLSQRTGMKIRLPSEAEWEYACRAGTQTRYSFGDDEDDLGRYAWFVGNAWGVGSRHGQTVHTKARNPWGLYDMHGNMYEWCEDVWHDSFNGAPTDGSAWTRGGDSTLRVLRGGSWLVTPLYCRSATRYRNTPESLNQNIGFRVCLDSN